jgi:hypothetical protein
MFNHIMIGARDLKTMVAFYDAVTPAISSRLLNIGNHCWADGISSYRAKIDERARADGL